MLHRISPWRWAILTRKLRLCSDRRQQRYHARQDCAQASCRRQWSVPTFCSQLFSPRSGNNLPIQWCLPIPCERRVNSLVHSRTACFTVVSFRRTRWVQVLRLHQPRRAASYCQYPVAPRPSNYRRFCSHWGNSRPRLPPLRTEPPQRPTRDAARSYCQQPVEPGSSESSAWTRTKSPE